MQTVPTASCRLRPLTPSCRLQMAAISNRLPRMASHFCFALGSASGQRPDRQGRCPATRMNRREQSPTLDATQTKVVNAPALPERPPSTGAHSGPARPGARRQSEGTPRRPASPVAGQTPAVAGARKAGTGAGSRAGSRPSWPALMRRPRCATLVDQASFDPSLQMSVTSQAAHLSMDTGAAGALTAQLQITNGVADVRMTGEAAAVLARHGAELSLGLTAAGLQPGRLEITPPASAADLQSATSDGSGAGGFGNEARSLATTPIPSRSSTAARLEAESTRRPPPLPPRLASARQSLTGNDP